MTIFLICVIGLFFTIMIGKTLWENSDSEYDEDSRFEDEIRKCYLKKINKGRLCQRVYQGVEHNARGKKKQDKSNGRN